MREAKEGPQTNESNKTNEGLQDRTLPLRSQGLKLGRVHQGNYLHPGGRAHV